MHGVLVGHSTPGTRDFLPFVSLGEIQLEKNILDLLRGYVALGQTLLSYAAGQIEGVAENAMPAAAQPSAGALIAADRKQTCKNAKAVLANRMAEQVFAKEPPLSAPLSARANKGGLGRARRQDVDVDALEIKVLDALRDKGQAQSAMELCAITGIDIQQMRKLVANAERRGLLRFEGEKRGRKYALPAAPQSAPALTRVIRRKANGSALPAGDVALAPNGVAAA